jgi:hypothetical protein
LKSLRPIADMCSAARQHRAKAFTAGAAAAALLLPVIVTVAS